MKTLLRIAVGIMLTYGLLNMTACSTKATDEPRQTAQLNDDFDDQRDAVAEDLRVLRDDISEKIQRVGDRMEDAGEDTRQELSDVNEQLLDERERVDEALERVESS